MMKFATFLLISMLGTLFAAAQDRAPAPPRRDHPPHIIERFDRDGDGKLNEEEERRLFRELGPPPDRRGRGPGGPGGGPGGRSVEERETILVPEFDKDGDGVLNAEERKKAREHVKANPRPRGGRRGGRGRGPGGGSSEPAKPGAKLTQKDVSFHPDSGFYDTDVIQTIFLEFQSEDWEEEMADFYRSDVVVPAKLTIDGKTLEHPVGMGFRGNSSFFSVSKGSKRSFAVSIDAYDEDQRLKGYRTLNLLNGHADPSWIREALFSKVISPYIAMYKVNYVRVVINGENWGLYINSQQFNKDFLEENYGTKKGVRWKVPAMADGGFRYSGDEVAEYKRGYQLKTGKAGEEAWTRLIELCKTLHDATPETAMETLSPILDVDEALWFLAVDNVFQDADGYLSRASDFVFYQDPDGRFHVLPYDSNETFRAAGGGGPGRGRGPGGRRGPGGFDPRRDRDRPGEGRPGGERPRPEGRSREGRLEGRPEGRPDRERRPEGRESERRDDRRPEGRPEREGDRPRGERPDRGPGGGGGGEPFGRDPLTGANDEQLPLAKALLSVPALRARYLHHVRVLMEDWLVWEKIEPAAKKLRQLISEDVTKDTKKLYATANFEKSLTEEVSSGRRPLPSLKAFVEGRAKFLKEHKALQAPVPGIESVKAGKAKPGAAVSITATAQPEPAVATMVLYYGQPGKPFTAVTMELGDDGYQAEIPAHDAGTRIAYYVEARTAKDAAASYAPRLGERAPSFVQVAVEKSGESPVVLNELMASNEKTIADPQGEHDDWIELRNTGEEVIDLSGYFLSDNEEKIRKWSFPKGTTIAPGGFLLVWADEDGKKKGLHANFKLAKSGETIVLSNSAGQVVDVVSYEALSAGKTYARTKDGWSVQDATPAKGN